MTSPTPSLSIPPSPTVTPTKTPASSPPSDKTVSFEVWLDFGDKLFVSQRTVPFTVAVGQAALDQLFVGPTAEETNVAVGSVIPSGATSDITALQGGLATVEVPGIFDDPAVGAGATATRRLQQAQIVYTLTQYSTIDRVQFVSAVLGPVGGPFARSDFGDLLPAILVESPVIGETVSSRVTISGTANVFEATVNVRILDENGNEIARAFTTATCGTGCRGDYSVSVSYEVDHEQAGTIEVLDYSAKDGTPENVMSIPVVLTT